ncbi:MAG: plastocyanin/azurin family copper-binding protein [Candidatus Limnocylindria bacterium]
MAHLSLLAAVVTLAIACSSGAAPPASLAPAVGTAAPAPAAAQAADVSAEGFAFKPVTLDVAVGTKVTWTNRDAAEHTVTAGKPDAKETTFVSVIAPGKTFTFTFDKAGTFVYFCERHPSMLGTVTVK